MLSRQKEMIENAPYYFKNTLFSVLTISDTVKNEKSVFSIKPTESSTFSRYESSLPDYLVFVPNLQNKN